MQINNHSVNVSVEALLEALGQGLFNWRVNEQVLALVELDALSNFETCCSVAKNKSARGADILHSLCENSATSLARELYTTFQNTSAIKIAQLDKYLLRRKCKKDGSTQNIKALLDLMDPGTKLTHEIHLDNFVEALKDTVHNYKEVKVGKNLMQAFALFNQSDRLQIFELLSSEEISGIASYVDSRVYRQYLLEIPEDKLSGVIHEMKQDKQEEFIRLLLLNEEVDARHLSKALAGLYQISDSGHNPKPISQGGHILGHVFQGNLHLNDISSAKLAVCVQVMHSDEQYQAISTIFKQQELTEKQILLIDSQLKKSQQQTQGEGLKSLIESIHEHEGIYSLNTTNSMAYPILLELERLNLTSVVKICRESK